MPRHTFASVLHAAMVAAFCAALPAWSQEVPNCSVGTSPDGPPRQIIACGGAVTIEREPATRLRIEPRPTSPAPRVIEVQGGAILIDVSPGAADTQIRTPHAIATVRGTVYIVDVGPEETSVFVLEGAVWVRRRTDAATVTLTEGEGADVSPGEPLVARTWGAARANALLARFGR